MARNSVIKSVKVQHKVFRIVDVFQEWVLERSAWTVGELNTRHMHDPMLFALDNCQSLQMKVRNNPDDRLMMTIYGGMSPCVTVTYLEALADPEDGTEYMAATQTESFPRNELHNAIECFMTRWMSDRPFKASGLISGDICTRDAITTFIRGAKKPKAPIPVVPINITMSPEWVELRLTAQKMAKSHSAEYRSLMNRNGSFRELLLATKHLDNTDLPREGRVVDPGALEPQVFSKGVSCVVLEDSDTIDYTEHKLGKAKLCADLGTAKLYGFASVQ